MKTVFDKNLAGVEAGDGEEKGRRARRKVDTHTREGLSDA